MQIPENLINLGTKGVHSFINFIIRPRIDTAASDCHQRTRLLCACFLILMVAELLLYLWKVCLSDKKQQKGQREQSLLFFFFPQDFAFLFRKVPPPPTPQGKIFGQNSDIQASLSAGVAGNMNVLIWGLLSRCRKGRSTLEKVLNEPILQRRRLRYLPALSGLTDVVFPEGK